MPSEELAWIVDSEPSLPCIIALSITKISSPSTSPTITRSGRIRLDTISRSRIGTAPSPSAFASRSSIGTMSGWACWSSSRPSSRARSIVISRSSGPISAASARSMTVFPDDARHR